MALTFCTLSGPEVAEVVSIVIDKVFTVVIIRVRVARVSNPARFRTYSMAQVGSEDDRNNQE